MRIQDILIFSCSFLNISCEKYAQEYCLESCKEGEQERLGEHCYYWSTWLARWDDAKLYCESMNGSLAAVTSMEIHNFLMTKVDKDDRYTWYWIGGSDMEKEGTWMWEDGSEWDFTNWASQPIQQPSGGDNQDCLQIHHTRRATNGWNAEHCTSSYPFICSWRICTGYIYIIVLEETYL